MYPKATKLRFTAFNINSIDMNTVMTLRLIKNPATPSTNNTALRIRYQLTGIIRPPLAQDHRAHDRDKDQDGGDFERQQELTEKQFADLPRVVARKQRRMHEVRRRILAPQDRDDLDEQQGQQRRPHVLGHL